MTAPPGPGPSSTPPMLATGTRMALLPFECCPHDRKSFSWVDILLEARNIPRNLPKIQINQKAILRHPTGFCGSGSFLSSCAIQHSTITCFLFSNSSPNQNIVWPRAAIQVHMFKMWPYYCKCSRIVLPVQAGRLPEASACPEITPGGMANSSMCLLTLSG